MPPLVSGSGEVIDTTPAALTEIGAVPVIAPPPDEVTQVGHVKVPVVAESTSGLVEATAKVPEAFGRVSVGVPATACAVMMAAPEVRPAKLRVPCTLPATPNTGVAEAVMVLAVPEIRTVPAADVAGHVVVDHAGAALDPDCSIRVAVAVPARIARSVAPE